MFVRFDDSLADVDALWRSMDALLGPSAKSRKKVAVRTVWTETEDAWEYAVDLPGMTAEDVKIEAVDGVLRVEASRELRAPEGYRPIRRERKDWRFSRGLAVPKDADLESIDAHFDNGLLKLRLARRAETLPRQITVRTA